MKEKYAVLMKEVDKMNKGRKIKEEMKDVKIIKNEIDLSCNKRYFLLNLTTDERWIVEIRDRNWEKGPERYEVYYKVISTNTSTKIGDSLGEFIEGNGNIVVELENEEPDVNSEDIKKIFREIWQRTQEKNESD